MISLLMPALAVTYNQGQLGLLAKECLSMGKMIATMDEGKTRADSSLLDREWYNALVPATNAAIKQHNDLILYIFAGNSTLLNQLLVQPYPYI